MPGRQIEPEQLMSAVEQMPLHELDTFVARVLAVRAQREGSTLSETESTLLLRINNAIPRSLQQRFDELVARRNAEQLTPDEYAELLELTMQIEQREADRATALATLAQVRKTPLNDLMQQLGIQPRYA